MHYGSELQQNMGSSELTIHTQKYSVWERAPIQYVRMTWIRFCLFVLFACLFVWFYSGSPTRTWSLSCPTKLGLRTNTAYYSSELHGAGLSRGHQANVQHRWNQLLVLRISNFAVLLAIVAFA